MALREEDKEWWKMELAAMLQEKGMGEKDAVANYFVNMNNTNKAIPENFG